LEVALGSEGELLSVKNEPRAIARLASRLAGLGCERVLIEGGSYQNVLVAVLRASELAVVIINPRRGDALGGDTRHHLSDARTITFRISLPRAVV